jgi:hypothetical protein
MQMLHVFSKNLIKLVRTLPTGMSISLHERSTYKGWFVEHVESENGEPTAMGGKMGLFHECEGRSRRRKLLESTKFFLTGLQ